MVIVLWSSFSFDWLQSDGKDAGGKFIWGNMAVNTSDMANIQSEKASNVRGLSKKRDDKTGWSVPMARERAKKKNLAA